VHGRHWRLFLGHNDGRHLDHASAKARSGSVRP
jgi:hypothetical protein